VVVRGAPPPVDPVLVPTLTLWGLAVLAGLVGGIGGLGLRGVASGA